MAMFGPPAPDERVVALSGLAGGPFVAWGYRIDRHREPVMPPADGRRLASGTR